METMFEVRFPNDAFMMQSTFRFRIILYDMYIQWLNEIFLFDFNFSSRFFQYKYINYFIKNNDDIQMQLT